MDIETFFEKKKELNETLKKHGRSVLIPIFKDFLKKVEDEIAAVRWDQHTPYFNDGDSCVFTVHEPEFLPREKQSTNPKTVKETDWVYNYCYHFTDTNLRRTVKEFENGLFKLKEILEDSFGDHVKVIVRLDENNELEFEVEEDEDHD